MFSPRNSEHSHWSPSSLKSLLTHLNRYPLLITLNYMALRVTGARETRAEGPREKRKSALGCA